MRVFCRAVMAEPNKLLVNLYDSGLGRSAVIPIWPASHMAAFLYRCPNTGFRVQGYSPDEIADNDAFEAVTCIACTRVHLVNPKTGKVIGEDDDE